MLIRFTFHIVNIKHEPKLNGDRGEIIFTFHIVNIKHQFFSLLYYNF
ncbi:conserved hypothetical protein [Clostridioides difficile]|uniref:Uncharacterized protein n=1 Tax=Clostridioides difficile TaxID=1496 RepID=A0A069A2U6_CLODI|nr:conserved hypothetical protein [Clostridioides difficile]CDS88383.1 hypothetical protein BN1097_680001 [Clostridioides difficile]CDT33226.1 conserved hypothetical protein [Clostridioides difficile]